MTEKPIRGNYKGGIISNLRYPTLDNYLISGGMSREGGVPLRLKIIGLYRC